ncbi:unnamed protein product [Dovyalis caffra]|uniref:Uncharacterized protein n=1 Tax=Dovyalis caffra TaxID=77055 RepID=A0AAV1SC31_9ROSI|nr:unnamed protein product [Dovyalis caffra]
MRSGQPAQITANGSESKTESERRVLSKLIIAPKMATDAESPSPEEKPSAQPPPPPAATDLTSIIKSKALEETAPWIDDAMQQALIYQKTMQDSLDTAIGASKSRFSEIISTSQAHFSQTIDYLQDVKLEIGVYEDKLFGKVKEGINVAASHPLITSAVAVGLGLVVLKRPRRILYYKTLRLFNSEEALLSQADAKVKELRQSISLLKAESEKLEIYVGEEFWLCHVLAGNIVQDEDGSRVENSSGDRECIRHLKLYTAILRRASLAEQELIRGRTKLRFVISEKRLLMFTLEKYERKCFLLADFFCGNFVYCYRQAGKQIQGVISSAYKIERQAMGLRDILGELPRAEASRFRSQNLSWSSVYFGHLSWFTLVEKKTLLLRSLSNAPQFRTWLQRQSKKGMLCPRRSQKSVTMESRSDNALCFCNVLEV